MCHARRSARAPPGRAACAAARRRSRSCDAARAALPATPRRSTRMCRVGSQTKSPSSGASVEGGVSPRWRDSSRRSPQPCDYVRSRACSAAARLRVSLRTPCASSASYQEHIRCGSSRDKSFRRPLTRRPTCWATSCRRCARRPPRSLRPQPTCPTCRGPRPGRPKALPTARRGAPSARTAT